ncbi:MAG: AAA family ATPase [Patescibacteria group bacterium]|nr:AAA family ATPase [Patescibacteria group bacterium]
MDKELRHQVLRAAVRDAQFLRKAFTDVDPKSFSEKEEAVIAECAVQFYEKYQEPIGSMLRAAVDEKLHGAKMGEEAKQRLQKLLDKILGFKMEQIAVNALVDRVQALKREAFYDAAVDDLISKHEGEGITPAVLQDLVERANRELNQDPYVVHEYFDQQSLEDRIKRRYEREEKPFPMLMIDPIDDNIRVIGRGHFGMVLAPPGGGKGLCLCHIAKAYALQRLKVLLFTLEDPLDVVEDRLDASLSRIGLPLLKEESKRLRKRFRKQLENAAKGRLRIIDATDGTWTVTKIERVVDQMKLEGFDADAVLVDYDDEILCEKTFKGESARRFEFAEIYRRLRRFAKNTNRIVWTAAQTGRSASNKEVITAEDVAEDFSKVRKVFFAMAIGTKKDDINVKYLNIIKHRLDKGRWGTRIVSNYHKAIFYDARQTKELTEE